MFGTRRPSDLEPVVNLENESFNQNIMMDNNLKSNLTGRMQSYFATFIVILKQQIICFIGFRNWI